MAKFSLTPSKSSPNSTFFGGVSNESSLSTSIVFDGTTTTFDTWEWYKPSTDILLSTNGAFNSNITNTSNFNIVAEGMILMRPKTLSSNNETYNVDVKFTLEELNGSTVVHTRDFIYNNFMQVVEETTNTGMFLVPLSFDTNDYRPTLPSNEFNLHMQLKVSRSGTGTTNGLQIDIEMLGNTVRFRRL